MGDHHQDLNDWLERSAKVIEDYQDWRDAQDPRTLGLPPKPRTSGPADSEASIIDPECHR